MDYKIPLYEETLRPQSTVWSDSTAGLEVRTGFSCACEKNKAPAYRRRRFSSLERLSEFLMTRRLK